DLDIAAFGLHHHEGQIERVDLLIEIDRKSAIAVADADRGEIGAMRLGDRLADDLLVQQCMDRDSPAPAGPGGPSDRVLGGDYIAGAPNRHSPFSEKTARACALIQATAL